MSGAKPLFKGAPGRLYVSRKPGWRVRLEAVCAAHARAPFDWRTGGCAGFAVACIAAIDGCTPGELLARLGVRFDFTSEKGAFMALQAAGCRTLSQFCDAALPATGPMQARHGDLGLIGRATGAGTEALAAPSAFGGALGIVMGERVFAPGPHGLASHDRSCVTEAWQVG